MADEEIPTVGSSLALGSYGPTERVIPKRSLGDYMQDTFLDAVSGGFSVVRGLGGINEAIQTGLGTPQTAQAAREDMDRMAAVDASIKAARSETARMREELQGGPRWSREPIAAATSFATGILPYAPMAALGPWGAVPFGALAFGQQRSDLREQLQQAPQPEMEKNPKYQELIRQGLSDPEAREQLYTDATDPTKLQTYLSAAPGMVGAAAGAGGVGLMSKAFMRKETSSITDRVLESLGGINRSRLGQLAGGAAAGGGAGFAMGFGSDISRQLAEVEAGARPRADVGAAAVHGLEEAGPFAVLTGGLHGLRRIPPIGLDVETVSRMQAQGYGTPGPAQIAATGGARPMEARDIMEGYDYPPAPGPPVGPAYGPQYGPGQRPQYAAGLIPGGMPAGATVPPPRNIVTTPTAPRGAVMGREIVQGDIVGPEGFPQRAVPPVTGGRPMVERDITGEYGFPARDAQVAGRPRLQMREGDLGVMHPEYGYGPGAERAATRAGRAMVQGDITGEYGFPAERQAVARGPAAREMVPTGADIYEPTVPGGYDYGQFVGEPAAEQPVTRRYVPPPGGGEGFYRGPEPPPEPRGPRPTFEPEARPTRPEFPEVERPTPGGYPQEPAAERLNNKDRKALSDRLQNVSAQTRGAMAARLQATLDRGERPTLDIFPEPGRRLFGDLRERMDTLLGTSPRDVIDAIRGEAEPVPGQERLTREENAALDRIKEGVHPGDVQSWADRIEELVKKGQRADWAKMPASFRKALGSDRAAVMEALRKNPREAADRFAGREHKPAPTTYRYPGERVAREPEAAEAPPPKEEGPPHGEEEKPQPQREAAQGQREIEPGDIGLEGQDFRVLRPEEYGEAIEPDIFRRRRKPRAALPSELGLTRRGRFAPAVRGRMAAQMGVPLRQPISATKLARVMERAEAARQARVRIIERAGERRGLYEEPTPEAVAEARTIVAQRRGVQPETLAEERARTEADRKTVDDFINWWRRTIGPYGLLSERAQRVAENFIRHIVEQSNYWRKAISQSVKRAEARRLKDQKRKEAKRITEYKAREAAIKKAFENPEQSIDRVWTKLGLPEGQTLNDYLNSMIKPAGLGRLQHARGEGVPYGAMLPLDHMERNQVRDVATKLMAFMRAKTVVIQQAVNDQRLRFQAQRGGLRSDIGEWRIGRAPTGRYIWFDRAAIYNQQRHLMQKALEKGRYTQLKNLIIDFYIRERMLADGRIEEWERYRNEQRDLGLQTMKNEIARNKRTIADQAALERSIEAQAARVKRLEEGYGVLGTHKTIQAELFRQSEVLRTMHAQLATSMNRAAAAQARNEQITREMAAYEAALGHDPFRPTMKGRKLYEEDIDFDRDPALDNWADQHIENQTEQSEYNHRRAALEWMAENVADMPEAFRIELERMEEADYQRWLERNKALAAVTETVKVKPPEPPETDEQIRRRLQPENRQQLAERINVIDERLNKLVTALEAVKNETDPRIIADTLEYYLSEGPAAERIEALRRGEAAALPQRVERLMQEINDEAAGLEAEMRHYAEGSVPGIGQRDYGIRRLLDPLVNLADERNLPRGAYVRQVSHFLEHMPGHPTSIRPRAGERGEALRNHFLDIVDKVMGDVDVVVLTNEQMRLAKEVRGVDVEAPAFYDVGAHRIFISAEAMNSPLRSRILGHEFSHPLTEIAIQHFPEIGRRLDEIRKAALNEWLRPAQHELLGGGPSRVREIMGEVRPSAFDNVHEFIAELFNDGGKLASALETIRTTPEMRALFGTARAMETEVQLFGRERPGERAPYRQVPPKLIELGRPTLMTKALRVIKTGLTKLFNMTTQLKSRVLNDAVINSLDLFQHALELKGKRPRVTDAIARPLSMEGVRDTLRDATEAVKFQVKDKAGLAGHFLKWHDLNELGRRLEAGMQAVAKPFESILGRVWTTARSINEASKAEEIARTMAAQMRMPAKQFEKVQDYIYKENYAQADGSVPLDHPNNAWISPTSTAHEQLRERHAELEPLWADLSPDQQALRNRLRSYYDERHNRMLQTQVKQIIEHYKFSADPAVNDALTKHVLGETLDAGEHALAETVPGFGAAKDDKSAEAVRFRKAMKEIREVPHLRKIPGVWYPMMRRGKWVVEGVLDLLRHAQAVNPSATERTRGEFDFTTEAEREAFRQAVAGDDKLKGVKMLEMRDVKEGDTTHYRIKYNPLILQFFDSKRHAYDFHKALRAEHGDNIKLATEPERDHIGKWLDPRHADRALTAMLHSLEQSSGWKDLDPSSRAMLKRDLEEGAIRHTMAQSVRADYLPRRYAMGARKDLLRDFVEYSKNTSMTLAELTHRNELRDALHALDKYVEENKYSYSPGDPQGKAGVLRRQIQSQIHRQVVERPNELVTPFWRNAIARTLQLSYMDKLISPGFWVVNSTEPWLLGAPLLAGNHGFKAYAYITRAYRDIGAGHLLKTGFGEAYNVLRAGIGGDPKLVDNMQLLKRKVGEGSEAARVLDFLQKEGYLDRDAMMELEKVYIPEAGALGRTADWIDNASRQVNTQIENINRAVIGLAAYRLARESGGRHGGKTHEQALEYAKQMVHDVAGNYALYSAPEMFRKPYLRFALQFKRYAQRVTANYIRMIAGTVQGDPNKAAQLGLMVASQVAVSGALGLPTEPLKAAVFALNAAGVIDWNWTNVEGWVRDVAAEGLGQDLGMVLTRGAFRLADIGIGTRTSHSDLWTFGQMGARPGDWWQTLGHLAGGAPGAYVADTVESLGHLKDFAKYQLMGFDSQASREAEQFLVKSMPMKIASDVLMSASRYMGGYYAETPAGQPTGYRPDLRQAVQEGLLGIRTGESQEADEFRDITRRRMAQYQTQKNAFYTAYSVAGTAAERDRVAEAVENYNQRLPAELHITPADLEGAVARREKREAMAPELMGLPVNERQRALLPRPGIYRTGGV